MIVFALLGAVSLLIWLGIFLHPARPWDFQLVGDEGELPPEPQSWPSVCILVPARNERESLPHTLPALLRQDYPGEFAVIVIDDRSQDGTADVARKIAQACQNGNRLTILSGAELPSGWVGKVWALEQGAAYCGLGSCKEKFPANARSPVSNLQFQVSSFKFQASSLKPHYLLLTDADIRHAPRSLRRLVAESEQDRLALNSRMARLRCVSRPERLLIPPFVFFFNLLYPMRYVNDSRSAVAAAAGGCVLLAAAALERAGGFACIKDRIIDDVNLALQIKRLHMSIQMTLSRHEVESLRRYDSLATIWRMVRRTAFTELRYSWLRLLGAIIGMSLMFLLPLLWLCSGIGGTVASFFGFAASHVWAVVLAAEGFCAWVLMTLVYRPAMRFFELPAGWAWTLPLAGLLYGAMTVDSAVRHTTGMGARWR